MPDRKPPRLAADDGATLLALLRYQRQSFLRKVSGIDDVQAKKSPVASGTSLLWLVNHLADAEARWVLRRFAQRGREDWLTEGAPTLVEAVRRYKRVLSEVDMELEKASSLDNTCPAFDDQPTVNLRWIMAHLLEETARHAGHADILRELIDGEVGR